MSRLFHPPHLARVRSRVRAGVVLAVFLVAGAAQAQEQDVRDAFERYQQAALAGDGARALDALSASTVAYYDQALDLALDGDSATVAERPFMQRLLVLSLRHRLRPEDLRALAGAQALMLGIKRQWIDPEGTRRVGIGEVEIAGDQAVGNMLNEGVSAGDVWLRFQREDGTWRLDMTSMFEVATYALEQAAEQSGTSPDEFIFTSLSGVTGRLVTDAIWHPVGR